MVLGVLYGCSARVPFTHQMRNQYDLGDEEIKNIQFYISRPIILRRELENSETVVPGQTIRIVKNRRLEEIRIQSQTPGVAVFVYPNTLRVSFEHGNTLTFGSSDEHRNVKEGRYAIFADEWIDKMGVCRCVFGVLGSVSVGQDGSFFVGNGYFESIVCESQLGG